MDTHTSGSDLRAILPQGEPLDSPSDAALRELVRDLSRRRVAGEDDFFVVERSSDRTGQTYFQAAFDDGGYVVEYRDGGEDRHFQAFTDDEGVVGRALVGCARGTPGWTDELSWERLVL